MFSFVGFVLLRFDSTCRTPAFLQAGLYATAFALFLLLDGNRSCVCASEVTPALLSFAESGPVQEPVANARNRPPLPVSWHRWASAFFDVDMRLASVSGPRGHGIRLHGLPLKRNESFVWFGIGPSDMGKYAQRKLEVEPDAPRPWSREL